MPKLNPAAPVADDPDVVDEPTLDDDAAVVEEPEVEESAREALRRTAPKNNIAPDLRALAVPIDSLFPDPDNANDHPDRNIDDIMDSIAAHGQVKVIVVRRETRVVVAGNGTLEAVRRLGWTEVAANVVPMTDDDATAYGIADNATGRSSAWNIPVLDRLVARLEEHGRQVVGITADELLAMRRSIAPVVHADPDAVPAAPVIPVTQIGDVWLLGEHRLMCGDSTSADDVDKLCGVLQPILMVTDPPYGVDYDANWRNEALRADGTPIGGRAVGVVHNDDNASWKEAYELFTGSVAYVWHAGRRANVTYQDLVNCGFEIVNQIIWVKNNIVISRGDYHYRHEPVWYAVRKGSRHNWQRSRSEATVWDIDKPMKSETGHSAQKPIECMARPIRNNSAAGEVVYDPFLGSGTTVVAAHQLNRICLAMELDPTYVQVALQRFANFANIDPVRESDGASFRELKEAAAAAAARNGHVG